MMCQAGLTSETFVADAKLHPIIAGRKQCDLKRVQEETGTNIYMPYPFAVASTIGVPEDGEKHDDNIFITGSKQGVARAKEMLQNLVNTRSQSLMVRAMAIPPKKWEYLVLHQKRKLADIMTENGTCTHKNGRL